MQLPGEKIEKKIYKDIEYPTYSIGQDSSSTVKSYVAKCGHVGVLAINAKNVSLTQGTYPKLMTLPEGYRPKCRTFGVTYQMGWSRYQDVYIEPNGEVYINSSITINNGNIVGNISFAIE